MASMTVNGLAGGLLLGVGWVHSVSESYLSFVEAFQEPTNPAQEYSWAGFIAMIGCLLAFGVDEAVHAFLFHSHKGSDMPLTPVQGDAPEAGDVEKSLEETSGQVGCPTTHHDHPHKKSELSKMVVLLAGLSFHSFFVGFALGLGANEVGLFVAIMVHQFFEGIALGGRIMQSERESGRKEWYYDVFFALACPIGICVGIGIQYSLSFDVFTYAIVNGVFQGLSAGILIYVSLVHVVSGGHHDSPHEETQHKLSNKSASYVGLFFGVAIMSISGIWG